MTTPTTHLLWACIIAVLTVPGTVYSQQDPQRLDIDWDIVAKDGKADWFATTRRVPAGAEVNIRVLEVGTGNRPFDFEWLEVDPAFGTPRTFNPIRSFGRNELTQSQTTGVALRFRMPAMAYVLHTYGNRRVGLEQGALQNLGDSHRITFQNGTIVELRILAGDGIAAATPSPLRGTFGPRDIGAEGRDALNRAVEDINNAYRPRPEWRPGSGSDAGGRQDSVEPLRLGIEGRPGVEGVEVLTVLRFGIAADIGLRPGDRIVSINGVRTRDLDEVHQALERSNGAANIRFVRFGRQHLVRVPLF